MPSTVQVGLPSLDFPHRDGLTITERFRAFDSQHPWIYRALERLVEERLAAGAERVGMKALFEALRWRRPHGVKGLNNNYTALYARRLLAAHPEWASVIEVRRRRSP
ncbi:hypothetical protein AQI95_39535 [Streptomyces yokosukanensis]|uniref:Uncharacterized protein n=1 Tax=Streptomyces yokosukanensis TaxID=67386 RepID=A0A124HE18_9ACTN|nr:hypothetical protein [Streptomyces yokosukanensis]KUM99337.1 hypothetical protein AQI95_39535 [Streptomyces yokosukanensis]